MSARKRSTIGNPLRTRVIRELRTEWRKYIVIFIFLTLMIGFISGVYVANNSMLMATERVKQDMIREDGHFILKEKADDDLVADIEEGDKVNVRAYYVYDAYDDIDADDIKEAYRSGDYKENLKKLYEDADRRARENYENAVGDYELDDPYFRPVPVKLFENFRKDTDEDIDLDGTRDSGVRVYINRDNVNLYCMMNGKDATNENEIVIDRMHADNNGIKTGDKINIGGADFTVTGLVAFSNYSTLHKKGTDMMFDALTFDIAMTTQEGWDRINVKPEYEYAWLYQNPPENEKEQRRLSENFLKALITQAAFAENEIEDYTPEYANAAVKFAPEDFGSDKAMAGVILDVLIVVLAFIFAITESNMITKESSVIGTLRASGYTRKELTLNYMAAPLLVTLLGALVGNILGYNGFFSDEEIKDIDEDFIVSVITKEDIMKMAAQLDHSMGAFMVYFQYLCVLLSAVLIFLITKVIIERNEQSISMVKILGYSNREVASLYLVTTTLVVIAADIVSVFASREIMKELWKLILARMGGYFPMVIKGSGLVRMFFIVFAGYLLVMFIDFRRIRKIPMDQALKDME